jgi:hypothetical protein
MIHFHNAHVTARAQHHLDQLTAYLKARSRPDAEAYRPTRLMAEYWGRLATLEVLRPIAADFNLPLPQQPRRPV